MRPVAVEQWRVFGSMIRTHRLSHGWTLRGFARMLPTSPSYVCCIEAGRVPPPSDAMLQRMADVLDIPAITLFTHAGRLSAETLLAFWQHPAIPPVLSTIPGMTLGDAVVVCQQTIARLTRTPA